MLLQPLSTRGQADLFLPDWRMNSSVPDSAGVVKMLYDFIIEEL